MAVDEIEHDSFFGQDHIEGEPFVTFSLMRLASGGQSHRDFVDGFLDQLARRAFCVDRQLSANDFDEVGASERGLFDRDSSIGDPVAVEPRPAHCETVATGNAMRRRIDDQAALVGAPSRS